MDVVLELVKLTLVGIFSGVFSLFLGNRSFRHEKWWELRVNAYQTAIESLSDIVHYFDVYGRIWDSTDVNGKEQKKLGEMIGIAMPKIRQLTDSGSFLFSDEANRALRKFIDFDVAEKTDPDDFCIPFRSEAEKCLKELVTLSKIDLKIGNPWF